MMDYFTKSLEDSAIPNQESLTLVDVLVTSFFCCFWVSGELYSDQSMNLKFRLLQEVLRRSRKCMMRATFLHRQSGVMVEGYVMTQERSF
jgi:uncharacterized membrane protein